MRIAIHHRLSITPPPGTVHALMQLLLTPQSGVGQKVESWTVDMPGLDSAARFTDAYGNIMHLVNQSRPEGEIVVTVDGVVETVDKHGVLGRVGGEPVPGLFKRKTSSTQGSEEIFGRFKGSSNNRLEVLHGLMAAVGEALIPQEVEDAAAPLNGGNEAAQSMSAAGVTQSIGGVTQSIGESLTEVTESEGASIKSLPLASEFAHQFIGAARALNIPARYVTGYLADDEGGSTALHAWAEAFDDRLGWIGFDPMLQLCPTEQHVRLAAGLDAHTTQPLRAVPLGDGVRVLGFSVAPAT
ncbi:MULTISPECIES: transglutaminase family protein [unclassified Devosia]|uniref:transglutaminase family protein n=1 Tax=unclassified Devosia TaxID=196773 RepID=UPI0015551119|nr:MULTISPECIES: transglutaminase family protein [unclassified Devosia]